jgi:hypothetical protein
MATDFENAGRGKFEKQQLNDTALEFAEIKNILSPTITGFDATVLKQLDDPLETVKRKGLSGIMS